MVARQQGPSKFWHGRLPVILHQHLCYFIKMLIVLFSRMKRFITYTMLLHVLLLSPNKCHPNETCYIKSLWRVDIHHILLWGLPQRFQSYAPFSKFLCTYRESVAIIFHSFQVINMIFFMCWLLWQRLRRDRDIFITMNDSSLFFLTFKTVIIYNKLLSCLKMDHGSSKTALIQELPGAFDPMDPWPWFCPGPTVGLAAPWPPASFSGFQLWETFTPVSLALNIKKVNTGSFSRIKVGLKSWIEILQGHWWG